VDTTRTSWVSHAEGAIRSLRDVDSVRIRTEGDEIREIHVISSSARSAKQIVRDIESLIMARFHRQIDHRIVSVAKVKDHPHPQARPPGQPPLEPPPRSSPERVSALAAEPERPAPERIRFGSVNLYVSGSRAQAQVELKWKGVPRMGSATGSCTRDRALRLVAQATLATVQEFLDEGVALSLDTVEVVRAGHNDVAIVALDMLAHRAQKTLAGCCTVGQDVQEAVVLATLSALNRIVGGLPTKEPTEYVLRPASS